MGPVRPSRLRLERASDGVAQAVTNPQVASRLPWLPPVMRTEYEPALAARPVAVRVPVEVVRVETHCVPLGSLTLTLTIWPAGRCAPVTVYMAPTATGLGASEQVSDAVGAAARAPAVPGASTKLPMAVAAMMYASRRLVPWSFRSPVMCFSPLPCLLGR